MPQSLKLHELPPLIRRLLVVILLMLFIPIGLAATFLVYIEPDEFGVKEVQIGLKRGIQPRVYEAGCYLVLPFGVEKMHKFPRNVQVLEFSGSTSQSSRTADSHELRPAAMIQTSDGFYVDVDVSILYRISDPYKVMTSCGPNHGFLDQGILPKAVPILKQTLGELTTEDFFNSPMRVQQAAAARDMLDLELKPKGLGVENILIRFFKYSPQIQENIEAKKLQDQLVFKNQAEARAAIQSAVLKRTQQEGEMNVRVTLQEGDSYKVKKAAEKDLYMRTRKAEADLLVKLAEARSTELKTKAMQAVGAERKVALAMAEVLEGLDTIVVPTGGPAGFNPLSLDSVLALFGIEAGETGTMPALDQLLEPVAPLPVMPEAPVPQVHQVPSLDSQEVAP